MWNLTNYLGTLFTSPNENKPIHKIFRHEHWKNLQHILKFHTRPHCDVKLFKCLRKKIFHSNFNFHFGLVSISSKHSSIPLQNSQKWEITQHMLTLKINNFFNPKGDERTCEHVELPLIIAMGPESTSNKNNNKICEQKKLHIHEMLMCYPELKNQFMC